MFCEKHFDRLQVPLTFRTAIRVMVRRDRLPLLHEFQHKFARKVQNVMVFLYTQGKELEVLIEY